MTTGAEKIANFSRMLVLFSRIGYTNRDLLLLAHSRR